jgi:hypothetical protein
VRNINGWSLFSPIGYLLAGTIPGQPKQPQLLLVDSTTISLKLFPPASSGGTVSIQYVLEIDQGSENTAFTSVATYFGTLFYHDLSLIDGLVLG